MPPKHPRRISYLFAGIVEEFHNIDVAMLAPEVTPVLKALRTHGLNVVAIHNHMTGGQPTVYFLHYWGTGPVEKLATGFKAALNELGKGGAAHAAH